MKNSHYNFLKPKGMSSDYLFCLAISAKAKDILSTLT